MLLFALLLLQVAGDCNDALTVTGRYVNEAHDFEVTIPPGLKGLWNAATCQWDGQNCICMGDHGRFINLPNGGSLEAYAGLTPDSEETMRHWARQMYERFGGDDPLITRVHQRWFHAARLGGLRAYRFRVEYERKGLTWIEEEIALRVGHGTDYLVSYVAPKDDYGRYAGTFEAFVRSWKLTTEDAPP
jgi:hypothetical protein